MKKFKIVLFTCLFVLLTFIVIQFVVNEKIQDYKIQLSETNHNYESILTKEYWEYIIVSKEYDTKYGISVDIYDSMSIKDGYLYIDGYGLNYTRADIFLRALVNNDLQQELQLTRYSAEVTNTISPVVITIILIIEIVVILIVYSFSKKDSILIFTKEYWVSSRLKLNSTRNLCLLAILFACQVVAGLISLPSGFGNLGIGLSYLFQASSCLIFGPVVGLLIGGVGDTIGYFLSPPSYPFFFGYTLNAMLSCFMYGLCFYRSKITFTKVLLSRIFINLFINVFLGSIWWSMISNFTFDQGMSYLLFISLPKNLFYLVPQSVVLFVVLKYSVKIFYANNYIDEYQTKLSII